MYLGGRELPTLEAGVEEACMPYLDQLLGRSAARCIFVSAQMPEAVGFLPVCACKRNSGVEFLRVVLF